MQDTTMQTDAGAGESALSTALVERLLRRRTEPLGVIDVRQPQQHYACTAGWVAQRFALLEHWQTRYGSDADAAAANAGLVFAVPGHPMAEPRRVLASPMQLARTFTQADVPQPHATPVASSTPQEQFQIRRRGVAPALSPQTVALPHARHNSAAPADSDTATSNSSVSSASSRRSGDSEATAISQAERGVFRTLDMPAATAVAPIPSAVNVSRVEAIPASLPLRLQRKSREATTGLAKAQELPAHTVFTATAQWPLSQSLASQWHELPLLPGGDGSVRDLTSPVAERAGLTGSRASLAIVESPAYFPLIQRQVADNERTPATVQGDVAGRRAAIAAEIRAASSDAMKPVMVWRQIAEGSSSSGGLANGVTGGARSALPLSISAARGGELQVARQTTAAESVSSTNTENTTLAATPPMPAVPPANEIDIAHLAEQVSRLLARQLAVERERRGRRGWH